MNVECKRFTTMNTCSAIALGFATSASAKPSANVMYPQHVSGKATRLKITGSPSSASVVQSATQQFSATGQDQFATSMLAQPAFAYSVNSGGTISTNGLLTATTQGYSMVTATSGSVSGSASVPITPTPVYEFDCAK